MNPKQVREDLQSKYGLRVLRIYMDNTAADKPLAVFRLIERNGDEAGVLTASLPELGFDLEAREQGYASLALPDTYRIPLHIVAALRAWLADDRADGAPLWLRLSVPLGLLPAVPWEELLHPLLGVPILRLPYQSIYPRRPPGGTSTVVCFSSPVSEPDVQARLDAFIGQVGMDLARATRFHLFGNRAAYPALLQMRHKYAGAVRIEVYDPAGAPARDTAVAHNPWLHWIAAAMGEGRVDIVHFLCHCDRLGEFGALMMGSEPGDAPDSPHPCRAEAAELIDFLDHVGAWCTAFTSAPAERSAAGMRMLQTQIARHRPGPLLAHDMNVAGSAAGLDAAYRFLFSGNRQPPASAAVSLYCHPVLLSPQDVDEESSKQLREFTLEGRLGDALHDNSLPGYLVSSQRKLECSAGFLAEAQKESPDGGRVRARNLVLDAVSDYARSLSGQDGTPGEKHE